MTAQTVDLRAEARALLAGGRGRPLAMRPDALRQIAAVARADSPVLRAIDGDALAALGRADVTVRGASAVIPLRGVITPAGSLLSLLFGGGLGGLQGFRASLREALASDEVSTIVLDVDSPGGLVDLVTETAAEVRAAREQKPIIAVANTLIASAAYWLAAQADEVVVTPSGDVGSIGVYMVHEDWSAANAAIGVEPTYIAAGRYKTEGNPDEPLSDEARAAMQASVDDLFDLFVEDVAAGRGTTPDAVRNGYGEGRVLRARAAVAAGLADSVASFEETFQRVARARQGARRADSSDATRMMAASDNPEPNGTEVPEEVRARIAEAGAYRPPLTL